MSNIKSFPNNQDEFIGAEPAMKWLHGRTSGVFGANGNASVLAAAGEMAVEVSDGMGWLSNDEGDGIVWWIDNFKKNGSRLKLQLDLAESALNRIDRVVVSWETTNYVALPTVSILKGTPSSKPTPPALTNDGTMRQISLAQISVKAGTVSLLPSMITDERLDKSVCGIVTENVSIDTTVMMNQFNSFLNGSQITFDYWFENIKGQLSGDVAGNLQNQIDELNENKAAKSEVAKKKKAYEVRILYNRWSASAPFTQTVAVSGMVSDGLPLYDLKTYSKAQLKEFAKITKLETAAGSITVTAAEKKPEADIDLRIEVVY